MLYPGQPVTAHCGSEFLCTVSEPIGAGIERAIVNVLAIITEGDGLIVLKNPRQEDWYVASSEHAFRRASVLFDNYNILTGVTTSTSYSKEDIKQYSIKGRMI